MTRNYFNNITTVQNLLDHRTLLEGLAKEAADLSQAALKVIEAEKMNGNVISLDIVASDKQLLEKIADVQCFLNVLGVSTQRSVYMNVLVEQKMLRWIERLENDNE